MDIKVHSLCTVPFSARNAQGLGMRQTPQQNLAAEQQFHRQHNDTAWGFYTGTPYFRE